jgi:DNA-binding transcriptional LysR family regulator
LKQGTKIRQITENIFKDADINPNIIFESASINTVQFTAANNEALSILPEKIINYHAIGNSLVYFSINPEKYYWPIIATFRKNSYISRAAKDFISILKSYLNSTSTFIKNEAVVKQD